MFEGALFVGKEQSLREDKAKREQAKSISHFTEVPTLPTNTVVQPNQACHLVDFPLGPCSAMFVGSTAFKEYSNA